MKKLLVVVLLAVAAVIGWGVLRKSAPPRVNFAAVKRQRLVSTLPTNGKVEPFEWRPVHAEAAGFVSRVDAREGESVAKGAILAAMTDPAFQAEIDSAQAKVAELRSSLAALEAGGKPRELTEIENSLSRARLELEQQTSEYQALRRLSEKQAATGMEVKAAQDKMRQTEVEIQGIDKRRASLIANTDVTAAKARLEDAEAQLNLARQRAAQSTVRASISGVVYGLAVRPGMYLSVGDLVANIGQMDRLRVRVYVDEPELGRVAPGEPVAIRWQALPGKKWQGTVEQKPSAIQALGSRQVGEVVCDIANPGRELIPGTNVDAEIRTAVVEGALVIPREALRHDANGDYVLLLKAGTVERRAVKTGASSIALVEVVEGLSESDAVALPSDTPLKPGDNVTAVMEPRT